MTRHLSALFALIAVFVLSTASSAEPVKRALLVGVNAYAAVTPLTGSVNDVLAMRSLLINRFGFDPNNINVLTDTEATHEGIVKAIRTYLIEPSHTGDVAVFQFSGHGSYMQDVSGDEADGWDETIVPQDSRTMGVFDISDDELNDLFAELAAKTQYVTVVLDSCHSGTAGRGFVRARSVPRDTRRPPPAVRTGATRTAADDSSDIRRLGASFTLLSGARSNELSYEDVFDGKTQGVFTYHLVKALQGAPDNTYRSFFPTLAARVTAAFPSQHPQIEGSGMDSFIFGTRAEPTEPYVLVEPQGADGVKLTGGVLYGLARDAEIAIYAPGPTPIEAAQPIARAKLTSVEADSALGRLLEPATIPAHSRARLSTLGFGATPKGVAIQSNVPRPVATALTQSLKSYPSVRLLTGEAARGADFRVETQGDQLRVLAREGSAVGQAVPTAQADAAATLAKQIHGWSRWSSLATLDNPYSSLRLDVSLHTRGAPDPAPSPSTVPDGTVVTLNVRNGSGQALYIAVLDMTESGVIHLAYPAAGAQELLSSGAQIARSFRMGLPEGARGGVTDIFKVIAASVPFDGSVLEQGRIGAQAAGRSATPPVRNPLEQLLFDRADAVARDATQLSLKEWTTAAVSIRTLSTAPLLDQPVYALHFDKPMSEQDVANTLSRSRDICPQGAAPASCVSVVPMGADHRVFRVSSPSLTSARGAGPAATPSVGQAFEEAYALRSRTGAQYAEPLLTVKMPDESSEPPAMPGARSALGGASPPDPIAKADDHWSLKYAGVIGAWNLIQQSGTPHGQEAKGILIAHPDTGFTRHPENWEGATPPPIAAEKGHDYIDDDDDASDPLSHAGLIPNPGHGTGSGSVIVSPEGCQLANHTQCVSGVAQGARLVPLRVNPSVAVFDTRRLIDALTDAAEGTRFGKVDLVSIAMGGPPSKALQHAVEAAERNGVMVFAAAGNYTGIVVWPARFKSVIAVAAINPQCKPWTYSARGSAVDISAPGEGVWRASLDTSSAFDLGMGAGTTFATGTTAGVAALWLARYAADPVMIELRRQGKVTQAFRAAAAATAWRPNGGANQFPPGVKCPSGSTWQSHLYGPGIVNAAALLQRPLSVPTPRAIDAAGDSTVSLFGSLYDPAANRAQVESAYRAIFSNAPLATVTQFESEILYQYTLSEEVRAAIDRLVGGAEPVEAGRVVRAGLRAQDISQQLRDTLGAQ